MLWVGACWSVVASTWDGRGALAASAHLQQLLWRTASLCKSLTRRPRPVATQQCVLVCRKECCNSPWIRQPRAAGMLQHMPKGRLPPHLAGVIIPVQAVVGAHGTHAALAYSTARPQQSHQKQQVCNCARVQAR
jgi:hypothetical protein